MKNLREIQEKCFSEYIENGYLEEWTAKDNDAKTQKKFDIGELGLFGTEIAEAQEEIRNEVVDMNALGIECADIIIRVLNFMSRKGLPASFYIDEKTKKNHKRGKLHGRAV